MDGLTIRSRRTVLPEGERPAAVSIRNGRITALSPYEFRDPAGAVLDLGDVALLPGLVDTHVHVNEPGRTEWEGFATATRAAASGGVTTIVDMPLNSLPPTVDPAALAAKRAAAEGACAVDTGFWGGAIPGNLPSLRPLHELGVFGFKCFMSDSGVPEFPPLPPDGMRDAFREVASFGGLVLVHAEDPASLAAPSGGGYAEFLASRPPSAERVAVERVVRLAEETGVRAHILHVSAADCLDVLAKAQADGLPVTAETCPHYLTLTDDDARGTASKCCPPIRDAANREALWQGLASGVLSCVVTDHSPCTPELKRGDFATAWGGISSLQLGLPVVWTAARARGHTLHSVVRWMSEAPAALAGVSGKGAIAVGNDADLVAFAPDETFTVTPSALHHRHPVTPYEGRTLAGAVHTTWLRGVPVTGSSTTGSPAGRLLTRQER
ncbi:allantoinase AllB [Actinomadura livida]|uniref:allantoinase n=1 Tax=Actinomadura livida TaxID=79909 RepID=A0A7W7IH80_9ACTN|nr:MULTISPECIES: allantoinase AllB [Actinomadura]MBB4777072.1 allantoinase [Actinomadura catellatispora]GGU37121.1 allantoinase [Actinomadura livida]